MYYKKEWGGVLKNRKKRLLIPMALLLMGLSLSACANNTSEQAESVVEETEKSGLLGALDSYQGYTRTISAEEYDFYQYFVKRDLPGEVSEEELDKRIKEYANQVNAVFYLGNRLGFCEPYSFEVLKLRMEQENINRQIQLEQGEVIYGLEQFTLQTYFQYTMDNVRADLQGYLEANADEEIFEMAKTYYETHEEEFTYRKEVVFEQTMDGVTETVTADVDLLSFYGKADMGLADFLGIAQVGEVYEDDRDGKVRRVVLKKITYNDKGYENNAQMAVYLLIREELYDQVIANTAKNNPVQFETN